MRTETAMYEYLEATGDPALRAAGMMALVRLGAAFQGANSFWPWERWLRTAAWRAALGLLGEALRRVSAMIEHGLQGEEREAVLRYFRKVESRYLAWGGK